MFNLKDKQVASLQLLSASIKAAATPSCFVNKGTGSSDPLLRSISHFTSPSLIQEGMLELPGEMEEAPDTCTCTPGSW